MKIVADIGGTKTRMAGSHDLMGYSEPMLYDTPKDYKTAIETITQNAHKIAGHERIEVVQIGIRGNILKERGAIFDQDVLVDWSEKPLAHDLRVALSIPTVNLANDVATIAMGEAHFGAGKDARSVVYFTVSTGVNACCVIDGSLENGGRGPEIGGQYLNIDPTITFEEMVSGAAIQKQFGMHPKELGKDNPLWDELAELCAYGVHNTILHWSPERVVLGGSMFNEIGISVPKVAENVRKIMRKFPDVPEFAHAELGDFGGLWGGLALLRQGQ
jgi:predicted NBD/HSP70 family sugar kinase